MTYRTPDLEVGARRTGPPRENSGGGFSDDDMRIALWPRLLNIKMAALYLGLAPQTIRNHAAELPGRKRFGRKVLYDRLELDRLIDRNNGITDLWLDARRMLMR